LQVERVNLFVVDVANKQRRAIRRNAHGELYLTPKLRPDDWVERKSRARQFSTEMTPRQREIIQVLGEGRPMKEIASLLDLSEKTVEFHKHRVMKPLEQRRPGFICLEARIDLAQFLIDLN